MTTPNDTTAFFLNDTAIAGINTELSPVAVLPFAKTAENIFNQTVQRATGWLTSLWEMVPDPQMLKQQAENELVYTSPPAPVPLPPLPSSLSLPVSETGTSSSSLLQTAYSNIGNWLSSWQSTTTTTAKTTGTPSLPLAQPTTSINDVMTWKDILNGQTADVLPPLSVTEGNQNPLMETSDSLKTLLYFGAGTVAGLIAVPFWVWVILHILWKIWFNLLDGILFWEFVQNAAATRYPSTFPSTDNTFAHWAVNETLLRSRLDDVVSFTGWQFGNSLRHWLANRFSKHRRPPVNVSTNNAKKHKTFTGASALSVVPKASNNQNHNHNHNNTTAGSGPVNHIHNNNNNSNKTTGVSVLQRPPIPASQLPLTIEKETTETKRKAEEIDISF